MWKKSSLQVAAFGQNTSISNRSRTSVFVAEMTSHNLVTSLLTADVQAS